MTPDIGPLSVGPLSVGPLSVGPLSVGPLGANAPRAFPTLAPQGLRASFEFSPPKTEAAEHSLWETVIRLAPLQPTFFSVTYGAGGSTRQRTHDTVVRLKKETSVEPAAHLTCVAATQGEIDDIARAYWDAGIRHIVALRGDPPAGMGGKYTAHPDGYADAAALVAGLKKIGPFQISVAGYPEKHPDSPDAKADLENLKRKVDAGADRCITQFFFDADDFLHFRDRAAAAGVVVPIVPGIMPVSNFQSVTRIAGLCGSKVPPWLAHLFDGLDDDLETRRMIAATVAGDLCRRLHAEGVDQFHFYTLNRADLTFATCHLLGLRPARAREPS